MTKMTVVYAVFVAVLLVVVVRRHTRLEEESGRAELLGGTAIGRDAQLGSAEAVGASVSLLVGLLAAVATVVGGLPLAGSLAFGASWAGTGLVATGLTALTCQLSASARTCASMTAAVVGAMFVLRAVGDTAVGWLSWLLAVRVEHPAARLVGHAVVGARAVRRPGRPPRRRRPPAARAPRPRLGPARRPSWAGARALRVSVTPSGSPYACTRQRP